MFIDLDVSFHNVYAIIILCTMSRFGFKKAIKHYFFHSCLSIGYTLSLYTHFIAVVDTLIRILALGDPGANKKGSWQTHVTGHGTDHSYLPTPLFC